jgi:hypothetical protein
MCGTMAFLRYICAAGYLLQNKPDRKANPSKCVCALCSTTAFRQIDDFKNSIPPPVGDLEKGAASGCDESLTLPD